MTKATRSDNPAVRIVAYNTSPKQPDTITEQRVKLHATHGSADPDDVEDLLEDGVDAGKLEEVEEDVYCVAE